jgi:acetone carboxylase beta subunit
MGIDAGGTMTDTFSVRADGRFVVGKSQSSPDDESFAILESSADALSLWGRQVDEVYPQLVTCVFPAQRCSTASCSGKAWTWA